MRLLLTVILGSLILCGLNLRAWAEGQGLSSQPNVVLIVVDTLAADFLGTYRTHKPQGYLSPSPNLDKLSAQAVTFLNANSTSSWTKPAVASVFTGLYPSEHEVTSIKSDLHPKYETLAETLKGQGYKSAGFVSHDFLSPSTGYAQGFDQYKLVNLSEHVHRSVTADQVSDLAIGFLEKESKEKFFLFLHYFDPHFNYFHHDKFSRTSNYKGRLSPGFEMRQLLKILGDLNTEDINYLKGLYEEEIAYTDFHISRVIDSLKQRGLDKNTLLIITADHGEEFLEHGNLGHTRTLYQELLHVPLIISWPALYSARQVLEPVSTLDITPTILEILKIPTRTQLSGRSLTRAMLGEKESLRTIFAEVDYNTEAIKAFKVAAIREQLKAIFNKKSKAYEFFDLANDPKEKNPVIGDQRFRELQKNIEKFLKGKVKPDAVEEHTTSSFKEEEVENLKSLGYL